MTIKFGVPLGVRQSKHVVPGGSQNVFVACVFKHPVLWIKDFGLLFLRLDKLTAMENYHL